MHINMVKQYSSNRGFVASVINNQEVDYLQQAYLQALSIKTTQTNENNYAVIVDKQTADRIEPKHEQLFDVIDRRSRAVEFCTGMACKKSVTVETQYQA